MKKIILASTSPRRHEILKKIGIDFEIINPCYEEGIRNKNFSYELIENTALNKGLSVSKNCGKESVIISADTVVVYDSIILGKPKDYEDAFRMLKMLSNNTHRVITAVCIIDNEKMETNVKSETTEVTFKKLTTKETDEYISKHKPYDKAGAYGIQEIGNKFVKDIKGEYDNVVGLPSSLVINMLKATDLL